MIVTVAAFDVVVVVVILFVDLCQIRTLERSCCLFWLRSLVLLWFLLDLGSLMTANTLGKCYYPAVSKRLRKRLFT